MEGDATLLLRRVREGEPGAAEELFALCYQKLHGMAGGIFRSQRAQHTLGPTAVVHEAYLKMVQAPRAYENRAHFFNVAARAMRQVLVNHARDRAAQKRGGGVDRQRVTLSDAPQAGGGRELDVLSVHEALEALSKLDARQARLAELRFFAGLTTKEAAEVLGVSTRSAELDWKMAKDWLAGRLGPA